ncbi:unnamed protein product [Vitrella brassicaformis CCMP3155]|uniref:Uncharacterized protein n=2 Tax=Vitrella brassicaformis TaxID=1169539 RepID=A0A0G4FAM5_VITBC|nr:unnamed protein product [Vitrella brassicaformis CCMP3155]|eukprot:CEM09667.1 unnamed protein product [Vitrella brassicaformis CCMP3155]
MSDDQLKQIDDFYLSTEGGIIPEKHDDFVGMCRATCINYLQEKKQKMVRKHGPAAVRKLEERVGRPLVPPELERELTAVYPLFVDTPERSEGTALEAAGQRDMQTGATGQHMEHPVGADFHSAAREPLLPPR